MSFFHPTEGHFTTRGFFDVVAGDRDSIRAGKSGLAFRLTLGRKALWGRPKVLGTVDGSRLRSFIMTGYFITLNITFCDRIG